MVVFSQPSLLWYTQTGLLPPLMAISSRFSSSMRTSICPMPRLFWMRYDLRNCWVSSSAVGKCLLMRKAMASANPCSMTPVFLVLRMSTIPRLTLLVSSCLTRSRMASVVLLMLAMETS